MNEFCSQRSGESPQKSMNGMTLNERPFRRYGQVGIFLLVLLVFGAIGLYVGYGLYLENNFIVMCDGEMTHYFDMPAFTKRTSPLPNELLGQCFLKTSLVADQVNFQISNICSKKGYLYKATGDAFEIQLSPKYKVYGFLQDGVISLAWKPNLTEKLKRKAEKATLLNWPPGFVTFLKKQKFL